MGEKGYKEKNKKKSPLIGEKGQVSPCMEVGIGIK
jgi:hypothetical protein